MLERTGYQVTALTGAREAILEFETHPDHYDLIIPSKICLR